MEALVTGAFGNIGSRVIAALVEEGHRVTCFDLDTPANRRKAARLPNDVRVVYGDVTSPDDVARAVRGKDAVVHLAAILPPASDARPELAEKVNVGGTRHVVEAIAREAPSAVLVFASSISVHGYSAGREAPCRVDTPLDGRDAYARHKIACEALLRASSIRWVALRIGACAGPDDRPTSSDRATLVKMMFSLDPSTRVEFLHSDDAAIAIAHACTSEAAVGKVLLLGSGARSQITWRTLVSTFPRALGLGDLPADWFGREPYYTDWMDTEESERLLRFQRLGYPAYAEAVERKWRWARIVLMPFRPIVRRHLRNAAIAAKRA